MSKRPLFAEEFHRFMEERGVSSFDDMATELHKAGFKPGKSGDLYRTKISGFIHTNSCVNQDLFYWCDIVYDLGAEWPRRFALSMMRDALNRELDQPRSRQERQTLRTGGRRKRGFGRPKPPPPVAE